MNYCRNSVRLASVAAQTFEKLYSAHALALPDDTRKQRALELSKELHMIQQQSRSIIVSPLPLPVSLSLFIA